MCGAITTRTPFIPFAMLAETFFYRRFADRQQPVKSHRV
jgi:hypothetical protein